LKRRYRGIGAGYGHDPLVVGDAEWQFDKNSSMSPAFSAVSSFGDVLDAIQKRVKDHCPSGKILVLEFTGHGQPRGIGIKSNGLNDSTSKQANEIDKYNAKYIGEELKKTGLFEKNAVIILTGCSVGNATKFNTNLRPVYPQILANFSGLTVYAAGGDAWGTVVGNDVEVGTGHDVFETGARFADKADTYYRFDPH